MIIIIKDKNIIKPLYSVANFYISILSQTKLVLKMLALLRNLYPSTKVQYLYITKLFGICPLKDWIHTKICQIDKNKDFILSDFIRF